ncbi:MAG: PDZ domain-containing protein [Saprospiraceae bacterium]|nr:PDZ domain-containing protein [Saprospiraceae bacterium]
MLKVHKRISVLFIAITFLVTGNVCGQVKGLDLLGDSKSLTIPFSLEQGFMVVKIRLQKTFPMKFIFDTGAEHTIIFNKMYSDMLKLPYDRKIPILGADLSQEMYANIIRNIYMDLKGASSVRRDILVLEKNYLRLFETAGIYVDGIIGGEFFRGLVIEIDYKKKEIVLHHPNYWNDNNYKNYESFDIEVVNYKPYLKARTIQEGDTTQLNLLVDTGASLTFLLHANSDSTLTLPDYVIPGSLGSGLGGEVMGFMGLMDEIKLGKFEFKNVFTSFQDIDPAIIRANEYFRNGLIGNVLLSRFKVVINYTDNKLYLKANRKYNKKFEYDKSGITLYAFGPHLNNFFVKSVIIESPAYEAGIRPGDRIITICKKMHKNWSLEQISALLKKKEGQEIMMIVEREGLFIPIEFKLRDLLKKKKKADTL